ncbi:MAG: hypothetical protein ACI8XO_003321 [Verrucomicrobiales bacterium]|jgi:hypothetical protein
MSDPASPELSTAGSSSSDAEKVPWYLWVNLLSLDAVAVAVVWLWCFSVCEHVPILRPIYILLGLVVWLVYTLDRLMDALRMKDEVCSTPRHRFAKRFFVPLVLLCVVVAAVAIWMILYKVPFAIVPRGLMISLSIVLYFLIRLAPRSQAQVILPKEIFCGLIFALGTTFVVHELPNNFPLGIMTAEFILFAALCALNCIAISVWECEEDAVNDQGKSIVHNWSGVHIWYTKAAFLLAGISAWLGIRGAPDFMAPILVSVALSAALIGALGLAEGVLSKNLRRVLADVALLSPLAVVPILT